MLALAADPLLSVVDTLFVGRLGAEELAALGVNTALFSLAFLLFGWLATATTPLIATALARGDKEQAGRTTLQALSMAVVLGTGLAAALHFGADGALELMGAGTSTGQLHILSQQYLQWRAWAAPAVLVTTVGQGTFRGLADMRTPLAITVGANVINLALDPILIFGLHWDVRGAAAATAAAEWTSAAAYLTLMWRRREQLGLWPLPASAVNLQESVKRFLPFIAAGGAMLVRTALLLGTKTLAATVATKQGPVNIAAHQVLMQLWTLSSFILDSLAVAAQSLVAVELGKSNPAEARDLTDRLLELGAALGVGLVVIFGTAAPWLPSIFSTDAEVQVQISALLPLAIGMLPINALVYQLDGILVGGSDFRFLAVAMLGAAITTIVLLCSIEPETMQLQGVWLSLTLLMFGRLLILLYRYNSNQGPIPPRKLLEDSPKQD